MECLEQCHQKQKLQSCPKAKDMGPTGDVTVEPQGQFKQPRVVQQS